MFNFWFSCLYHSVVLRIQPKVLCMLNKHYTNRVQSSPLTKRIFCFLIAMVSLGDKEMGFTGRFHAYTSSCLLFSPIALLLQTPLLAGPLLSSFCFLHIYHIILPILYIPLHLFLISQSLLSAFVSYIYMTIQRNLNLHSVSEWKHGSFRFTASALLHGT